MDAVPYYLKANLVFTVLYAMYLVALRRETWFAARRAWLLGSVAISLFLPLMPLPSGASALMAIELPLTEAAMGGAATEGTSWWTFALRAHAALSGLLFARLGVRMYRTWRAARGPVTEASSFFHIVRVPEHLNGADRDAMMAHEHVHAREGHSFDVLAYELAAALFWSNPLWRIALREIRLVHEHAADSIASAAHGGYDKLLLARSLGVPSASLLNTFGSSNLHKRMTMLHNTRSPLLARRKLFFAAPALLLAIALVSWQAVPTTVPASSGATAFTGVDQQPEFPGGTQALMKYLAEQIRYPKAASEAKVQGTVYVGFTVKASGRIADVAVKRGVRKDLDEESVRVVSGMPAWKPGMSNGKTVDAQLTLPIAFHLGEEK